MSSTGVDESYTNNSMTAFEFGVSTLYNCFRVFLWKMRTTWQTVSMITLLLAGVDMSRIPGGLNIYASSDEGDVIARGPKIRDSSMAQW